jgi:hypothetical protein
MGNRPKIQPTMPLFTQRCTTALQATWWAWAGEGIRYLGQFCQSCESWPPILIRRPCGDPGRTKSGMSGGVNPSARISSLLLASTALHYVDEIEQQATEGKPIGATMDPLVGVCTHWWVDAPPSGGSSMGPFSAHSLTIMYPSEHRWRLLPVQQWRLAAGCGVAVYPHGATSSSGNHGVSWAHNYEQRLEISHAVHISATNGGEGGEIGKRSKPLPFLFSFNRITSF